MDLIETEGLTRRFDGLIAVQDLDLKVRRGEVFGFLGPNGAGKTTTIRMLCALIAPTSGRAYVDGMDVSDPALQLKVRQMIGLLPESPGLYETLSAWQNLDFFGKMYGMRVEDRNERIGKLLRTLDLWDRKDEAVGGFSKGMRQKVAIARALVHNPDIVFLDEPTSGLDPIAAVTVRNHILELRKEGRTVFINTHNLDEAQRLCDRIGILRSRLLAIGNPAELADRYFGRSTIVKLAIRRDDIADRIRIMPGIISVVQDGDRLIIGAEDPVLTNPKVVAEIVASGGQVEYVEEMRKGLEDVYLKILGGKQ